jgi:hypothetical protein
MKRTLALFLLPILSIFPSDGTAKAFAEFRVVIKDATAKIKEISRDFAKARDSQATANALDKFAEAMLTMKREGDRIEKAYNLKTTGDTMPEELKPDVAKFESAVQEMTEGPMTKALGKYGDSDVVRAVLKKLQEFSKD